MILHDPWVLLLIIPVVLGVVFLLGRGKATAFLFPTLDVFQGYGANWRSSLSDKWIFLRVVACCLILIALARPQLPLAETRHQTEGIDIVLAVDASGSMAAEDFTLKGRRINRLAVVKDVVRDFISGRHSDRIALVAFAGRAYTVCPLTTDYAWLEDNLERVELGLIEDGTAVGSAISSSLSRLRESQAKSKVVILLTDGVNNAGKVSPRDAAEAARALGVKIYTIGAGTRGPVPFPARDLWGNTVYQRVAIDLDEETLKEIAALTRGKYFNATDTESLRHIYQEIDLLERTKIEHAGYREYRELFPGLLLAALGLLCLEIVLMNTLFLRIP